MKRTLFASLLFGLASPFIYADTTVETKPSAPAQTSESKAPEFFETESGQRFYGMSAGDQSIGRMTYQWKKADRGVRIEESSLIKVKMVGKDQVIQTDVGIEVGPQLRIEAFDYRLQTPDSVSELSGRRVGDRLRVEKTQAGYTQSSDITMGDDLVLGGVMIRMYVHSKDLPAAGKTKQYKLRMLEAASISVIPIEVEVKRVGTKEVYDVLVRFENREMKNRIDGRGRLLEEKVILPPSLEVIARPMTEEAYKKLTLSASTIDLVEESRVSFPSIRDVRSLKALKVRIEGVALDRFNLNRHRQSLEDNVLTIRVEDPITKSMPAQSLVGSREHERYLRGDIFVPVQHPDIQRKAREIIGDENDLWQRALKIHRYVFTTLKKEPYISLPDAIETLKTKRGDCNEHAALYTALARAAGVPTRMVVGLVHSNTSMTATASPSETAQQFYGDQPGFYYHAWVEVFTGHEWVAIDPTWNQVPADATHIAFIEGGADQQVQLVSLVGKVKLTLVSKERPQETL